MTPFDQLLTAARVLLASRYQDGEVDAVALSVFKTVVDEVGDGVCLHQRTTIWNGGEAFHDRVGCLDCNTWLHPVRVRSI